MKTTNCYSCGISFGMPDDYYDYRLQDHRTFWCPNGHSQSFLAESEAAKYKRLYENQVAASNSERVKLEAERRAKEKAQKALAVHKTRSAAGVCPCCNRTVSQLAAHMRCKHPDFMQLQGITARKQLPGKVQ